MIGINVTRVLVDDQQQAPRFYTNVLGFVLKCDISLGSAIDTHSGARWLTVAAASDPDGVQLLLEPNGHPAAKAYQDAIYADGIPATSFASDDIHAEIERLRGLGVRIVQEPIEQFRSISASIDDSVGNLIGLHQVVG